MEAGGWVSRLPKKWKGVMAGDVSPVAMLYPKPLIFVCYLVIFCYHYHQNYHHHYHWTVIIIIGIFSAIRAKRRFWRPKKEVQVARNEGGGRGDSGNARKKTFFFLWRVPLVLQVLAYLTVTQDILVQCSESILEVASNVRHWRCQG